jgi:hypothetical protein
MDLWSANCLPEIICFSFHFFPQFQNPTNEYHKTQIWEEIKKFTKIVKNQMVVFVKKSKTTVVIFDILWHISGI